MGAAGVIGAEGVAGALEIGVAGVEITGAESFAADLGSGGVPPLGASASGGRVDLFPALLPIAGE